MRPFVTPLLSLCSIRSARRVRAGLLALFCALSFWGLAAMPAFAFGMLRVSEDSPHAQLFRRFYDTLPDAWKSFHDVRAQEVSGQEMEELVANSVGDARSDDSIVDGFYLGAGASEYDLATITLRETLSSAEASHVFAHEYGHLVWDELLTETQRRRYTRLWRDQKHVNRLITPYAAENSEEGFAEAFSYFLRKPTALKKRDMRSWQFLQAVYEERSRALKADA